MKTARVAHTALNRVLTLIYKIMNVKNLKNRWIVALFSVAMLMGVSCAKDGEQGAPGKNGVDGVNGKDGKDGASILSGAGVPNASLGKIGDFYFDTNTKNILGPKTEAGWGIGYPLKGTDGVKGDKGDKGTDGNTILSGTTDPAANAGKQGDYYLNTSNQKLYGPKTASGWGTPVTLKGKDGNANVFATQWIPFDGTSDWWSDPPTGGIGFFDRVIIPLFDNGEEGQKHYQGNEHVGNHVILIFAKRYEYEAKQLPEVMYLSDKFGTGKKVMQGNYFFDNYSQFSIAIKVIPLDGNAVTPYQGDYHYRVVCIGINSIDEYETGDVVRPANIEAVKEELKSLSYEEVCKRFNLAE